MVMIETGEVKEEDGWEKAAFFENAIFKHRSLLQEFELEETAIDKALWAALEGKWEFDSIDSIDED
jgi:hypothetical protein